MRHERFDLEQWKQRYPKPGDHRSTCERSWWSHMPASSPGDIVHNEIVRRRIWPNLAQYPHTPCDLVVWAWAAGDDPMRTRIGGVPFMDQSAPWPEDDEGRPMGFVSQINFEDSLDLVGKLPGKILLFFCRIMTSGSDVYLNYSESYDSYRFIWVDPRTVRRPRTKVVSNPLDLWPLHGVLHRTFDVPKLDRNTRENAREDLSKDPLYQNAWPPAIWWGTKIGGVPYWEQGRDLGMTPAGGRFIGQVLSDHHALSGPHPYLNCPEPFALNSHYETRRRRLCIGDAGSAYFYLTKNKPEYSGGIYFCSQA